MNTIKHIDINKLENDLYKVLSIEVQKTVENYFGNNDDMSKIIASKIIHDIKKTRDINASAVATGINTYALVYNKAKEKGMSINEFMKSIKTF